MTLRLDWCSFEAASYACQRWHYSRSMPASKTVKIGAWENGRFIGCVIFSRGATPKIGSPYGLKQTEVCELTRVALDVHEAPVTRIVAIAIRFLRKVSPKLRLIISYAASEQGHHGGIYQGGNWVYAGAQDTHVFVVKGKRLHAKSIHSKYGTGSQSIDWLRTNLDPHAEVDRSMVRHKYLMPLDLDMWEQIRPLAQPYPKRA